MTALPAMDDEVPVCWMRMYDGRPDWDEHCVNEVAGTLLDGLEDEPRYTVVALYQEKTVSGLRSALTLAEQERQRLTGELATVVQNEQNCWKRRQEAADRVIAAEARAERAEAKLAEANMAIKRLTAPAKIHDCTEANDEYSTSVCEGTYADKVDSVIGLHEALRAIIGLVGGHDEQSKRLTIIAQTAINEHCAWLEQ